MFDLPRQVLAKVFRCRIPSSVPATVLDMHYPFEILDAIISLLGDKKDLKSIRLVSKNFAVIGAAHLFTSVHISTRQQDLHDARMMFENFGQCIKTIVIVPAARVSAPSPFQRKRLQKQLRRLQGLKITGDIETHVDHIHEVYRKFSEEQKGLQRRILPVVKLRPFLTRHLQLAPRVDRVCFSKIPTKDLIAEDLSVPCEQLHCTEMQRSCHDKLVKNRHFTTDDIGRELHIVLATMSQVSVRIQHLDVLSIPTNPPSYIIDFRMSEDPNNTHRLLSSLTTLRLKVEPIFHRMFPGVTDFSSWLAIISPNIEKLWLEAPDSYNEDSFTQLGMTFNGFRFPKLKAMFLQDFDSTDTELIALVQRCDHLEELKIKIHQLRAGTWGDTFRQITSTTNLKPITTRFDYRGELHADWTSGVSVDFDRTIEASLMKEAESVVLRLWFWGKAEPPTYDTLDQFINQYA